jgi:hypothetical protein
VSVFGVSGTTSNPILPTCGSNNGQFAVRVEGSGAISIDVSIDNGATYQTVLSNNLAGEQYTTETAGVYHIKIRVTSNPAVICDSFTFLLRSDYNTTFTHVTSPATGCNNADGSILLGGLLSTDSVSWISSYTPQYTVVSSLSPANTITGLIPGRYYVTVKGSSTYCFSTADSVVVGNSGTACPAATFCATAADSTNLFPDGTFGSGLASQLNAPPLPVGQTSYQYQPIGPYSPEDGFYAIASNTFVGTYTSYNDGNPKVTPFDNTWAQGWDHDHWVTGSDSGYMLVVNADVDPNIVISDTVSNLCVGKTYQFSAYIRSLNGPGFIPANETFLIDGVGLYNTGNLLGTLGAPVQSDWHQVGFTFVATGTQAVFSLRNNAPGGGGNDFALDDIYVGSCVPSVVITPFPADPCNHPPAQDTALVTDASDLFTSYEWQVDKQDGNGYVFVGGVQTGVFGSAAANAYFATLTLPIPMYPDSGWAYRVVLATNPANLPSPTCSFISQDSSVIPVCSGPPLPVTFITIKALLNGSVGDVYWQVGSQLNVDHYELEKSIDGGLTFTYVASIPVINSSSILNYEGEDNNLTNGVTYYRVKSVDTNGAVGYSNTAKLVYAGDGTPITIYPNPVSDLLSVLASPSTKIQRAIIYDAIGRKVLEEDNFTSTNPTIPVSTLAPGFYNIKLIEADGTITNLDFIKK